MKRQRDDGGDKERNKKEEEEKKKKQRLSPKNELEKGVIKPAHRVVRRADHGSGLNQCPLPWTMLEEIAKHCDARTKRAFRCLCVHPHVPQVAGACPPAQQLVTELIVSVVQNAHGTSRRPNFTLRQVCGFKKLEALRFVTTDFNDVAALTYLRNTLARWYLSVLAANLPALKTLQLGRCTDKLTESRQKWRALKAGIPVETLAEGLAGFQRLESLTFGTYSRVTLNLLPAPLLARLRHLRLTHGVFLGMDGPAAWEPLSGLTHLSIDMGSKHEWTDRSLQIRALTNLEHLVLADMYLRYISPADLAPLTKLTVLKLGCSDAISAQNQPRAPGVNAILDSALGNLRNLRHLSLTAVLDAGADFLWRNSPFEHLETLEITDCPLFVISPTTVLPKLRTLSLRHTLALATIDAEPRFHARPDWIAGLTTLESLTDSYDGCASLAVARALPNLRELSIERNASWFFGNKLNRSDLPRPTLADVHALVQRLKKFSYYGEAARYEDPEQLEALLAKIPSLMRQ